MKNYQELVDRVAEQLCYSGIVRVGTQLIKIESLGDPKISEYNSCLYWELKEGITIEIDPNEGLICFDENNKKIGCYIL